MVRNSSSAARPTTSASNCESGALSQGKIVRVGRRLMEQSGVESITMRRMAAEMGVTAMALYRHVPDKKALIGLIADAVVGEVGYPGADFGPWHVRFREPLLTTHREIMRYPGLGLYIWGPQGFYPSGMTKFHASMRLLVEAGFDESEALNAIYLVTTYEGGYFLTEKNANELFETPESIPPNTIARIDFETGNEWPAHNENFRAFLLGLDTIIAGLRAQLAAKTGHLD